MKKTWFILCLIFILPLHFPLVSSELEDGLVAYWNFDETSGNLLDRYGDFEGSLNGITFGYPGVINDSYYFDGVGDYIVIEKRIQIYDAASFSLWIKTNDTVSPQGIISKRQKHVGENDWFIGLQDNILHVYLWGTEVETHEIPFSYVNEWKHIVATYDGSSVKIYLDGIKVYEAANSGVVGERDYETRIGDDFWDNFYQGQIDEMGIWERALSEEEVYALYNNGEGLTYSGDYSPAIEERVSFLEYLGDLIFDKLSEITSTLENQSIKLDNQSKRLQTCENKIKVLENKTVFLENKTTFLEKKTQNSTPTQTNFTSPYLKYLSSTDRKSMICGYATEKKLKNYIDLGLNCTLTYKTFSSGKITSSCKCLTQQ